MTLALLEAPRSIVDTATRVRRVLLVSYHFPPVGGAGVQRPVKFVKYLPEFGWDATVLVAANPSVPVLDESLCRDLPDTLRIVRARTLEPGYAVKKQMSQSAVSAGGVGRLKAGLRSVAKSVAGAVLQPDPQILWLPAAYRAACRALQAEKHDAILATAPPYSNLILGTLLKKRFGLPLVVDFRDEWDLSSEYLENSQKDRFTRFIQPWMQRWVLKNADAVVATTQASTSRLHERAGQVRSRAFAECIYNGYDEEDFEGANPELENTPRFRLVYTGTLWNLTSVAPIVEAVERLHAADPDVVKKLELVFVGRKTDEQRAGLQRVAKTGCTLVDRDYCDHHEAVALMRTADALCLLLSDVPGADRVAPAKLFEYLAAGRPILAVTPEGETAGLVREFFPENHFLPKDGFGIATWIEARLRQPRHRAPNRAQSGADRFSRRNLTGQLAEVLDRLV
jgi:glycosyltransferase involved in cell wall biosynthesis